MPGLHLTVSLEKQISSTTFNESLNKLEHDIFYSSKTLIDTSVVKIGCTSYQHYPVRQIETNEYLIFIEGKIYNNEKNLENNLVDIANIIFSTENNSTDKIIRWLKSQDGDFLIVIKNKKNGQWAILNDILGRLPVYLTVGDNGLILSREIRFITSLQSSVEVDKLGIAQNLIFGYSINNRTFLKNIERIRPATLICFNDTAPPKIQRALYTYNFAHKQKYEISEVSEELAERFRVACKNRIEGDLQNIVSLSGGLDSRAVAAGLKSSDLPFSSLTFEYPVPDESLDLKYARETAKQLDIKWDKIILEQASGLDIKQMIKMKGGMNIISNALLLPFIYEIEKRYAKNVVFFSGDGGDKLLPNLNLGKMFRSLGHLCHYILQRNQLMPYREILEIFDISKNEFIDELKKTLNNYPEKDRNQKYVHFMIYERAMRWLFEGEDCNRSSFWAVTPFYNREFFELAMSVNDSLKKNHSLYKQFIIALSPKVSTIPDAKRNMSILEPSYRRKLLIIDLINRYPLVANILKRKLNKPTVYNNDSSQIKLIHELVNNSPVLSNLCDSDKLKILIQKRHNTEIIDNLLTILLALESHKNVNQTIDRFLFDKI